MTEEEWLTDIDGRQLLIIEEHASVRKLRLIAAVYIRLAKPWRPLDEVKHCCDLIEDGADNPRRWEDVHDELFARPGESWQFTHILARDDVASAAKELRRLMSFYPVMPPFSPGELIREVVGNPFRRITFDHSWSTSDVMLLAQGIYDNRAFDRMPILADALQDAGCANDDILAHCRDTSLTHARGCWVVDLVLGKS